VFCFKTELALKESRLRFADYLLRFADYLLLFADYLLTLTLDLFYRQRQPLRLRF
jgi:hypothetical protein